MISPRLDRRCDLRGGGRHDPSRKRIWSGPASGYHQHGAKGATIPSWLRPTGGAGRACQCALRLCCWGSPEAVSASGDSRPNSGDIMRAPFDWGTLAAAYQRGDTPMVRWGAAPTTLALPGLQPVYLATPYSKEVLQEGIWNEGKNLRLMSEAAHEIGRLKHAGVTAISPVVMAAALVDTSKDSASLMRMHDPLDAVAWTRWCQPLLQVCRAIVVPDLEGWSRSAGIKAEVDYFIQRMLPVYLYARGDEIEF